MELDNLAGTTRTCKGICGRTKSSAYNGNGLYSTGHKRCNVCECYFKTIDLRCVCCGNSLRCKPRNGKYKEPFRIYVSESKGKIKSSLLEVKKK